MTEYITPRQYAIRRGVSHTAIGKAIADGRISQAVKPKGKRSVLHVRVADYEFAGEGKPPTKAELAEIAKPWPLPAKKKTKRKTKKKKAKAKKKPADDRPPGEPASTEPEQPGNAQPTLAQARAFRETYRARLERLKYEEQVGQRIPTDAVRLERFAQGRVVRDAVLNLPNQIAPALAAKLGKDIDPHVVAVVMESELRDILTDVANANAGTPEAR